MHSFSPSAPPQFSMHSPSTPSAPYQFRLSVQSQSWTGSATQFAPYQTSMPYIRPVCANPIHLKQVEAHSFNLIHSSIAPPQMHHTSQVHITTPTAATQPQGKKRKGWSHQRLRRLLRMHPDTWKQLDMLGVNHLCKVQGNEESKK